MQNAKDSFYIALRDRLALLNPGQVISVRGVKRPAILVEEAENPTAELQNDTYVLRWTQYSLVDAACLTSLSCEIHYATSGSEDYTGLDRGRLMTEMDSQLRQILAPSNASNFDFSTVPPILMPTSIFWAEPTFAPLRIVKNQLLRVAAINVFTFEEVFQP